LFVFIYSPCESDEKEHYENAKGKSTSSVHDLTPGNWAEPGGGKDFTTKLIILGVLVVGLVIYLIVKPAKDANAVRLAGLDSVLTTPSSLLPWTVDSLGTSTVRVNKDSEKTIVDGKVSVIYERDFGESKLSFKNIIGVANQLDGPFDDLSIHVIVDDVFYIKVSSTLMLRVKVIEEGRDEAVLVFNRDKPMFSKVKTALE
jgi:hypothetical protein